MQILSLNTNGFYGYNSKNNTITQQLNSMDRVKIGEKILEKIFTKSQPDIIIFSEFNLNSLEGTYVKEYLCGEKGYYLVNPNQCREIPKQFTSIVLAFTKKEIKSEKSLGLKLKWNEIIYGDYRIIGVHIPDSTNDIVRANNYWNDILSHFEKHKHEKVVYVGDMNVYNSNTLGKDKLNILLNKGAKDAWEIKNNFNYNIEEGYTCKYRTRIDYAIMTKSASEYLYNIENVQEIFREKLSDHAALIIDIQ